jgi:hypothetical protein
VLLGMLFFNALCLDEVLPICREHQYPPMAGAK